MSARFAFILVCLTADYLLTGLYAQQPPVGHPWVVPGPQRPGVAAREPSALDKLFAGQRMGVDPNLPAIALRGTRERGLERSVDGGKTWLPVREFPALPLNGIGMTLVEFAGASGVPGQPTPVIFVGVADPIGNLFWSRDTGKSWKPVAGGPVGVYPVSAGFGADGWMQVGFIGLDGVHGAVEWGLNPRTGAWRKNL